MVFGINKQNMTRLDTDRICAGSKNFVKFKINFSSEWNGYTNTVVFTRSDTSESFYVYNVEHEKEYYVPSQAMAEEGVCFVNVIGTNGEARLATSNSCFFCIESAASGESNTETEITASLFAQLCARIEAAIAQYFSKEIVLSADENAVYWKYRDETESRVLFTFDNINVNADRPDCSKIEIDANATHIIWTKGNGKWEKLIELSKLKGEEGAHGKDGVSGVYVGSGDMPEGYNVQIDPEGSGKEFHEHTIPNLEKKIENIQRALSGQIIIESVDSSDELVKFSPENVLPYAFINEIGGVTGKSDSFIGLKPCKVKKIISRGNNSSESVFTVPEGVKALNGYGDGIDGVDWNRVNFDEKTYVQRFERIVFDGSEEWQKKINASDNLAGYFGHVFDKACVNDFHIQNHFDNNAEITSENTKTGCRVYESELIIRPEGVADMTLEEWKTYLAQLNMDGNPLTVMYELSIPVISDISDILTEGNIIQAYEGGSIEIVTSDENENKVPTKITYHSKNNVFPL